MSWWERLLRYVGGLTLAEKFALALETARRRAWEQRKAGKGER